MKILNKLLWFDDVDLFLHMQGGVLSKIKFYLFHIYFLPFWFFV